MLEIQKSSNKFHFSGNFDTSSEKLQKKKFFNITHTVDKKSFIDKLEQKKKK